MKLRLLPQKFQRVRLQWWKQLRHLLVSISPSPHSLPSSRSSSLQRSLVTYQKAQPPIIAVAWLAEVKKFGLCEPFKRSNVTSAKRNSENSSSYFRKHRLCKQANLLDLQTQFSIKQTSTFSIIHVAEDKLITWAFLPSQYIETYLFCFDKISYLYRSIWFSLQVLVATEETVSLTKLAFFLTPFCSVLMGKEYSTALDWTCRIQFSLFERKHCQEGHNLCSSAMCFIFSDNYRLNFIQRW